MRVIGVKASGDLLQILFNPMGAALEHCDASEYEVPLCRISCRARLVQVEKVQREYIKKQAAVWQPAKYR